MERYLEKSALVAEIMKRLHKYEKEYEENYETWIIAIEIELKIKELKDLLSLIDTLEVKEIEPRFHVGDKLRSTKNPSLTYEILEVGHINELGNSEYKVKIFENGNEFEPPRDHYLTCYKVDEWAELLEPKPAEWNDDEKMKTPITPEILEKNGFVANKHVYPYPYFEYINKGDELKIGFAFPQGPKTSYKEPWVYIDSKSVFIEHLPCIFIYQLQQILRLSGIEKEIIL